jgi:N6-L-threonylcarbamoyladenine synthase
LGKELKVRSIVLGIETSCDETAAAIVSSEKEILANEVLSQFEDHAAYGGVVPEIAARAHVEHLDRLIAKAIEASAVDWSQIDAIAATGGPGLVGGLLVGVVTAKALAFAKDKPFLAINHLEGHALSPRLMEEVEFPYLLLLVSGGHCQLIIVENVGTYRRLGTTIDDAVGEAFDKTAKLLGLGMPGGPMVEAAAKRGKAGRFSLPRPLIGTAGCDFSFSGLKTALWRQLEKLSQAGGPDEADIADLCAEFQTAISECLVDRTSGALAQFATSFPEQKNKTLVVAGGVASNMTLRQHLKDLSTAEGFHFVAPPGWLCTDNAAMIAWAGLERLAQGAQHDPDFEARSRWPLDTTSEPQIGYGKRGAKV